MERSIFRQLLAYEKKKKRNAKPYKKKPAAYPWNKRRKKNKNPKTQTVFSDQNSNSLSLPIPRCTFKHTDRTCVFQSIKHKPALKRKPKKNTNPKTQMPYFPIEISDSF